MAAPTPSAVVMIPLKQIRPSPHNPRLILTQEMIDSRAANMAQAGQADPIKVRPLAPEEAAAEPDPEVLYEIVDGEVRYRAALKNSSSAIEAIILQIGPDEAFRLAVAGNRANKPVWFEDYLAMERLDPHMPRKAIAALFEVADTVVSRGLRVLGVLNEASRGLILQNLQKPGPNRPISENALFRLTDLGDPQAVEKALPRVLDGQMTEPEVRRMVAEMKGEAAPTRAKGKAPRALGAAGVPRPALADPATPMPSPGIAPAPGPGGQAGAPALGGFGGMVRGVLWTEVKSAAHRHFHGFFPRTPRWLGLLMSKYQKLGPKDRVWAGFLAAGLVLFVAHFLFHQGGRLIRKGFTSMVHLSAAPQGGGQDLVVPSLGANGHGGTQQDSVPLSAAAGVPNLNPSEASFVQGFLEHALGPSDPMEWIDSIRKGMVPGAAEPFYKEFFPGQKFYEAGDPGHSQIFRLTQPLACLKTGPEGDTYLAQGLVTPATGAPEALTLQVEVVRTPAGRFLVSKVERLQMAGSAGDAGTQDVSAGVAPLDKPVKPVTVYAAAPTPKPTQQTDPVGKFIENTAGGAATAASAAATNAAGDAVGQAVKKALGF